MLQSTVRSLLRFLAGLDPALHYDFRRAPENHGRCASWSVLWRTKPGSPCILGVSQMTEGNPAQTILVLSTAYWASRCLHVVAESGIADALGDEPATAAALAAKTGTNPDALHRILRALVNHGVFALKDGRFSHNPASRLLRSDDRASMRSLARMMGLNFHWDVYRELAHSLKT